MLGLRSQYALPSLARKHGATPWEWRLGAGCRRLCFVLHLQAYTKARGDALARVGSRSPAAEAVSQLLLWGHPAAWLPTPIMAALLQLAAESPDGEQGELVLGAYQLLSSVTKVCR